jgi:catabolite regulation protein CreA
MYHYRIAILSLLSLLLLSGCTLPPRTTAGQATATTTPTTQQTKPYEIGSVDTAFQRIGPDHHIEIGAVPDPKVQGISCFYSRARTGGIK